MRRPQTAFGLVAVMSSLLVATIPAVPAAAMTRPAEPEAAPVLSAPQGACTRWRSSTTPPRTIRVLRTWRTRPPDEVKGTVQEVDFYEYVATVMAQEWPEHYPIETLKAGAIATKQFAWYYILHPRGLTRWIDGEKVCYDVVDTTADQWYQPESRGIGQARGPGPKIFAALDATWDISLRKYKYTTRSSRFFLTGYRSGSAAAACGEDATGFKLYHNSTRKCGEDGLRYREILNRYLRPRLEIVEPGRRDVIGTKHGDATAMKKDGNRFITHVWTPGKRAPEPGSNADLTISSNDLVGYRGADMDGDGRDDLVWLKAAADGTAKIKVALSDGVDYGPAETWWSGNAKVPLGSAHLLVGDFHADQRTDVAILGRGGGANNSKLVVLRRRKYDNAEKFANPVVWWSGAQDPAKTRAAWAGDISGDGRADLIVRQDIKGGGVRVRTAVTISPLPRDGLRMGPIKTRFGDTTLKAGKVRMVPADGNRDGREDVMMLVGGGRAKVVRLQGRRTGGFKRITVWTAPKADPIPVRQTRLGAADVNYDGLTDLLLYSAAGSDTRIRVLKTRYDRMAQGPDWKVGIPWDSIRPY